MLLIFSLVDRRGVYVPETHMPPAVPVVNGHAANTHENNESNAVNQTFHESYGATITSANIQVNIIFNHITL